MDRFKINIELEPYTEDTLEIMIRNYAKKNHKGIKLSNKSFKEISMNARLNPRTAIRLLDGTVCFDDDYAMVFSNYNIIKNGYTDKDIKVLNYLSKNKTCGCDSIASFINTPKQSYLYEIEPYLLQTGLIIRKGTGRAITQEGKDFLQQLNP